VPFSIENETTPNLRLSSLTYLLKQQTTELDFGRISHHCAVGAKV